jgi:hypothetical protein
MLTVSAGSCGQPGPPVALLSLCTHNEEGADSLREYFKRLATERGMFFGDRSVAATEELREIQAELGRNRFTDRVTLYRIWNSEGLSVSVGNVRGKRYQFGIGFARARDRVELEALLEKVSADLEKKWRVQYVDGRSNGIAADPSCS